MVSRLTHAVGGYLAAVCLNMNPVYVVSGALLPDLDYPLGDLHRKLFHNVWFVALLYWFGGLPFAVGVLSHLLLDSLTPRGVNWFWPIPFPRVRGPVVTGSFWDYALAGVMVFAVALLMFLS